MALTSRSVSCVVVAPELEAGEYWGYSEVADFLGIDVATVRVYRARKQMPEGVHVGGTWIWKADDIREWHRGRPGPGNWASP